MKALSWMTLLALALTALESRGEAPCCAHCGCHCNLVKVCKLVPDVKKETVFEYSVECEDFCVPGRSICCGKQCVQDGCTCHVEPILKPTCGRVHTRSKLVKKPVTKEKNGYKCVVEYVCAKCCSGHQHHHHLFHHRADAADPAAPLALDETPSDLPASELQPVPPAEAFLAPAPIADQPERKPNLLMQLMGK